MKHYFVILFLFFSCTINAQQKVIPLYDGPAPKSENWNWEEKEFLAGPPMNATVAYNVSKPTLTVYTPEPAVANGIGIIVCPGGGFRVLNIEHEGIKIAKELNKKGITVFVLKYRLVKSNTNDPWQEMMNSMKDMGKFRQENMEVKSMAIFDAETAMQYVRKHAVEYNLHADRIGVIGFSAGGSLAISLSLNDRPEIKSDFSGFLYSTISTNDNINVPANAPPVFIACATDDVLASTSNSIHLYNAWLASKRPVELHIFAKGGHGLKGSAPASNWIHRFTEWLDVQVLQKPK